MKEIQRMFEKHYKRNVHSGTRKLVRTEMLTNWFISEPEDVQEIRDEEFEAEKAKLMEELKEYRERETRVAM